MNKVATKKMTQRVALNIIAGGIDPNLSLFKKESQKIKLNHLKKEIDLFLHKLTLKTYPRMNTH